MEINHASRIASIQCLFLLRGLSSQSISNFLETTRLVIEKYADGSITELDVERLLASQEDASS